MGLAHAVGERHRGFGAQISVILKIIDEALAKAGKK
jgi:hypothetical protein